ncbi:MAG: histidine phosphatase family protein [Fibrobacter sp.]|nr:histidine phosphatase family protein [Fibrobacter sp.]
MFLSASTFFDTVADDERVYLLVRHGERGHITPNDPNYGAHVGLTERGREQAFSLGRAIPVEEGLTSCGETSADVCLFSSPVGRCVETAECIGKGCGIAHPEVEKLDCLAEFYVQNYDSYTKVLKAGFYEGICQWLAANSRDAEGGVVQDADAPFYPLADRSEEMLSMMFEVGRARFNVFVSHDAWVVPCLVHFCGLEFTPKRWMNFLTGLAVAVSPRGRRIVSVTALETGWLEF